MKNSAMIEKLQVSVDQYFHCSMGVTTARVRQWRLTVEGNLNAVVKNNNKVLLPPNVETAVVQQLNRERVCPDATICSD